MRVYLLLAALVLAGCAHDTRGDRPPLTTVKPTCEEQPDIPLNYACVFRLKDGTRCIAVTDIYVHSSAVTCEWRPATAARAIWPARPIWRRVYNV